MSGSVSVGTRSGAAAVPDAKSPDFYKNQALRAALASQKPPVPPKRLTKNGFVSSGALAAAARAGSGQNASSRANNTTAGDGAQDTERLAAGDVSREPSRSPVRARSTLSASPGTQLSAPQPAPRQASPSHIAAVRAAAARSTTSGATAAPRPVSTARDVSPGNKDEGVALPHNALVQMFEARSKGGSGAAIEIKPLTATGPPVVLSPKPIRAVSVRLTARSDLDDPFPSDTLKSRPALPPPRRQTTQTKLPSTAGTKSVPSSPTRTRYPKASTSPTVPVRSSSRRASLEGSTRPTSAPRMAGRSTSPPSVAASRAAASRQPSQAPSTSKSITTQMLVPDDGLKATSMARKSSHQPEHVRPQLNANSLANAIVAGSLATSRAPSPHKPPEAPLLPPPRRGAKGISRHASPGKTTLKATLRSAPPDADETMTIPAKGGKLRKHGKGVDLDTISAADRKLYEGVWAANRGILIPPEETADDSAPNSTTNVSKLPPSSSLPGSRPKVSDEVHGYVVKDIWSRSGLDFRLLEQIWNLVDGGENGVKTSGVGRLNRHEFVVGMWLIDQALMGRKLPAKKLPDEVWASLRIGSGFEFRR